MTTYNAEQLAEILSLHKLWVSGDPHGKRANLYGADLSGANLSGADLSRADLAGANLYRADLAGANLYRASLYRASLSGADLSRADLAGANLYRADLAGADLAGANLYGADLSGANLSGADLSRANLYRASLYGANLSDRFICQSGPLGSRRDYLVTVWQPEWDAEQVTTGCWRGTLDALEKRVAEVHGQSRYGQEYQAALVYHRAMLAIHKEPTGDAR